MGDCAKRFGAEIQARRKELNLTQEDLVDLCDVGINSLIKIERGQANPTVGTLESILEVLGLELTIKVADNEGTGGL